MSLLDEIQSARNGEVVTVPFKHEKLSRYIFLGKGLYHLLGGAGGSGKSAWVDFNYVINPALWYKKHGKHTDISLKIILRSLERSKERRKAKWVCMKLYLDYGILIDTASMLGWGGSKNKITDSLYEKIKKAYDWVNSLEDIVEIVGGAENPTGIFNHFENYALQIGTLYKYQKTKTADGQKYLLFKFRGDKKEHVPPEACPEATRYQPVYEPDDKKHITLGVIDHLQALKGERNYTNKQNLDKMSEYARIIRDLYGMSPVIVNQMNRDIASTYRRVNTSLLPEDKDFSGSSSMYFDCDVAGILFNPYKYQVDDVIGWKPEKCINEYGINRFRSFHLLKNTYGPDNQIFAYQFIGENGIFREMPRPEQTSERVYDKVANPDYEELIAKYTKED